MGQVTMNTNHGEWQTTWTSGAGSPMSEQLWDWTTDRGTRACGGKNSAWGRNLSVTDDAWSSGVVGLFGRSLSFCIVLCVCPLDMGIFSVFSALFACPM